MGFIAPQWLFQVLDNAGKVAMGAKLFSYVAGTSIDTPLYSDQACTSPLANPFIMDSAGRGEFWLKETIAYRLRVEDAEGNVLEDRDPIVGGIGAMGGDAFKVKVDADDTAPGFLEQKLADTTDTQFSPTEDGSQLDNIVYQLTGLGTRLNRVKDAGFDFDRGPFPAGNYAGGRGISFGRRYVAGVEVDTWIAQGNNGKLYWTSNNDATRWKITTEDDSVYSAYPGGRTYYGWSCIQFVYVAGAHNCFCWVMGSSDLAQTIVFIEHKPENYNDDGTFKTAALNSVTYGPSLGPYSAIDIMQVDTTGGIFIAGDDTRVGYTTDLATFQVVLTADHNVGGLGFDGETAVQVVERDSGVIWKSANYGNPGTFSKVLNFYLDDVLVSHFPTDYSAQWGSMFSMYGQWLSINFHYVSGGIGFIYSDDGIYWYSSKDEATPFYDANNDGLRWFATNAAPNSGTPIYQLIVSMIPVHRRLSIEKGAIVSGPLILRDLPNVPILGTDHRGRIVNGTADLSGYFVDLTTNQTVEGVKTFTDGIRVSDLTSGRMVSAGTGGRLQTLDAAAARATIGTLAASEKGSANGIAPLGSDSKIASTYLPSYVDDVIEVANYAALPGTGEAGKIYVTLGTNLTYRWSGSTYVEIPASLALGETSSTAYRGDRGKTAYDHSQITAANPHSTTAAQVGAVAKTGDTMSGPLLLDPTGGTGIGNAYSAGAWFAETAINDLCLRAKTGGAVRIGSGSGATNATLIVGDGSAKMPGFAGVGIRMATFAPDGSFGASVDAAAVERLDARVGYAGGSIAWFRFATLVVTQGYDSASCSCVVSDLGSSGENNRGYAGLHARIRLNGTMSAAITHKSLDVEYSGPTPFMFGYVVEQDDAAEKRIAIYCKAPAYGDVRAAFLSTYNCTFFASSTAVRTEPSGIVYASYASKIVSSLKATGLAGAGTRPVAVQADGTLGAVADAATFRGVIGAQSSQGSKTYVHFSNEQSAYALSTSAVTVVDSGAFIGIADPSTDCVEFTAEGKFISAKGAAWEFFLGGVSIATVNTASASSFFIRASFSKALSSGETGVNIKIDTDVSSALLCASTQNLWNTSKALVVKCTLTSGTTYFYRTALVSKISM